MKALTNSKASLSTPRKKAVSLKKTTKPVVSDFTYDLEAMKQALNSPKVKVPYSAILSDDSFDKWLGI